MCIRDRYMGILVVNVVYCGIAPIATGGATSGRRKGACGGCSCCRNNQCVDDSECDSGLAIEDILLYIIGGVGIILVGVAAVLGLKYLRLRKLRMEKSLHRLQLSENHRLPSPVAHNLLSSAAELPSVHGDPEPQVEIVDHNAVKPELPASGSASPHQLFSLQHIFGPKHYELCTTSSDFFLCYSPF
eukprot:TRINITY_DN8710_c0_g1_i2.p1 TRINITY_DN8710_c0_g1~~TRINITY_DN8710_c0_g1_i2.p1  ORF type:complete len:187 (+),score=9.99 TRINITY_DN8710_c0_g1_i2:65-625(+)